MGKWTEKNVLITDIGEDILSKAQIGLGQIVVDRVVCGTGYFDEDTLHEQKELKEEKARLTVSNYEIQADTDGTGAASIIETQLANFGTQGDITVGFDLTQIGVFVRFTGYAEPQLYFIAQCDEGESDWIPPRSEMPTIMNYTITLWHGNVDELVINIDPKTLLTAEHNEDSTAHKDLFDAKRDKIEVLTDTVSGAVRKVTLTGITDYNQVKNRELIIRASSVGASGANKFVINSLTQKDLYFATNLSDGLTTSASLRWVNTNGIYSVIYNGTYFVVQTVDATRTILTNQTGTQGIPLDSTADKALRTLVSNEVTNRTAADTKLQTSINTLTNNNPYIIKVQSTQPAAVSGKTVIWIKK